MWFFNRSVKFTELDFRTDIHSHILPGVDDGFRTEDRSARALELLHGMGLERSVLTPHIYPELYPGNTPVSVRLRLEEVSGLFSSTGVDCRAAGEHMVYAGVEDSFCRENAGEVLCLSGNFVLIEMSYAFESQNIREFIFRLNSMGYHPVLAHPERYSYYSGSLEEVTSIADMDTRLQLNILSLGGFYGNTAREKAEAILERGLYSYLGTDLHSLAQIDQLKSLKIKRKHIHAVERLLAGNDSLWQA